MSLELDLDKIGISVDMKRGEFFYHEGDSPESIYFIKEGMVGLFHITENGSETLLRVFGPGQYFGHRSFLSEENYHATSIALSKCQLVKVDNNSFREYLNNQPDILFDLCKTLSKELRRSEIRLSGMQEKTAVSRIIEGLVFLKLKQPDYNWTRKEIADFSGSTTETVTRVMTKLEKDGHITKDKRSFNIVDSSKLLEVAKKSFTV